MRYVLIDRLVEQIPGQCAVAQKRFDHADPLFQDHFPGNPIVPGTLLTELMAQTGGWAVRSALADGSFTLLAMIERAKFRRPVRPGDFLTARAAVIRQSGATFRLRGTVTVGDKQAAEATFVISVRQFEDPTGPAARAYLGWRRSTLAALTEHESAIQGES